MFVLDFEPGCNYFANEQEKSFPVRDLIFDVPDAKTFPGLNIFMRIKFLCGLLKRSPRKLIPLLVKLSTICEFLNSFPFYT